MPRMTRLWASLAIACLAAAVAAAQAPVACDGPLTHVQLARLLNEGVAEKLVVQYIQTCGVGFELTAEREQLLRAVNATETVLAAVRDRLRKQAGGGAKSAAASVKTDARGMAWARIPAGSFEMGCTVGDSWCDDDEKPAHTVRISRPFEMMTTEVTLGMYRSRGGVPSQPSWSTDARQPVVNVTWDEARRFCSAIGGRLPTEAEWEYAARGGKIGERYVWGNAGMPVLDGRPAANVADESTQRKNPSWTVFDGYEDGFPETAPVGSFPANAYGLHDMAGNVWEWVADWYDAGYYARSPAGNPTGPSSRTGRRLVRGGSWDGLPWFLRVSVRFETGPADRGGNVGFRCARNVSR